MKSLFALVGLFLSLVFLGHKYIESRFIAEARAFAAQNIKDLKGDPAIEIEPLNLLRGDLLIVRHQVPFTPQHWTWNRWTGQLIS